jgi:hypothetical protein
MAIPQLDSRRLQLLIAFATAGLVPSIAVADVRPSTRTDFAIPTTIAIDAMQHLRLIGRQGSAAQAFIGNLARGGFWLGGFLCHDARLVNHAKF